MSSSHKTTPRRAKVTAELGPKPAPKMTRTAAVKLRATFDAILANLQKELTAAIPLP